MVPGLIYGIWDLAWVGESHLLAVLEVRGRASLHGLYCAAEKGSVQDCAYSAGGKYRIFESFWNCLLGFAADS